MGFRKALYDVEEKGLNPVEPHTELGSDGRLKPTGLNIKTPDINEEIKKEEISQITSENQSGKIDTLKSDEKLFSEKSSKDAKKLSNNEKEKKSKTTDKKKITNSNSSNKKVSNENLEAKKTTKKRITKVEK